MLKIRRLQLHSFAETPKRLNLEPLTFVLICTVTMEHISTNYKQFHQCSSLHSEFYLRISCYIGEKIMLLRSVKLLYYIVILYCYIILLYYIVILYCYINLLYYIIILL